MVCWYEMATMASRPAMAKAMGLVRWAAAAPASTRISRISSVEYATEDSASEEKTARATDLERRSCRACASGIGAPTSRRFSRLVFMVLPPGACGVSCRVRAWVARPRCTAASPRFPGSPAPPHRVERIRRNGHDPTPRRRAAPARPEDGGAAVLVPRVPSCYPVASAERGRPPPRPTRGDAHGLPAPRDRRRREAAALGGGLPLPADRLPRDGQAPAGPADALRPRRRAHHQQRR